MSLIIRELLGLKTTGGDVGIEIELEAENMFPVGIPNWKSEHDHSLRGSNMEYILAKPCNIEQVPTHLGGLQKILKQSKTNLKYTERAGVHVHVNVQDFTVEEVVRFALLYYCFEEVLTKYCGPDREGNHFCLRVRDAQAPLMVLEKLTQEKQITRLSDNNYRYAALNFCSLFRFGSIEFRAMESQPDFSKINEWCEILHRFKLYAKNELTHRVKIAEQISLYGPDVLLRKIVGQELFDLLWYNGAEEDVVDSMRLAQIAIFSKEIS